MWKIAAGEKEKNRVVGTRELVYIVILQGPVRESETVIWWEKEEK
jgi:hypothetical protein